MSEASWDLLVLQEAIQEAPEVGFAAVNYGPMEVTPYAASWEGEKGARTKHTRPLGKTKLQGGETLELEFKVAVSELNPALNFDYTRNVPVKVSSARAKSDWSEIVEPSLLKVLGEKWIERVRGKRIYVCVEDVPNIAGKVSDKGKMYGAPKLVAVYKNLQDCLAARDARFGGAAGGTPSANGEIPAGVIIQAKALAAAIHDETQLRTMLGMEPFNAYNTDALLEAIA